MAPASQLRAAAAAAAMATVAAASALASVCAWPSSAASAACSSRRWPAHSRAREPLPLRRHDVVGVRGALPMADADRTLLAREGRAFQAFKLLAYLN